MNAYEFTENRSWQANKKNNKTGFIGEGNFTQIL